MAPGVRASENAHVERFDPWASRALVVLILFLVLGRVFPEISVWVSVPTGVIAALSVSVAGLALILWFALRAIESLKPAAAQYGEELRAGLFVVVAGLIAGLTTDVAGIDGAKALITGAAVAAVVPLGMYAAQAGGPRLKRVVYISMGIALPAIPAASLLAAGRVAALQAELPDVEIGTYAMFLVLVVVVALGLFVSSRGSRRSGGKA
jgi:hypothetical protein